MQAKKLVLGIKNIVTEGFGVCGQVDLINIQSMCDGRFQFLMNYIDHGIQMLTATPLVAKCARSVEVALLNIFTEQGPLRILQANNGCEFSGSATDHVGRWLLLDDEFIDSVISKIKQFFAGMSACAGMSKGFRVQWRGRAIQPDHSEEARLLDEGEQC